jgi:NitT/TauT family transport system permease protein
MQVRRQTRLAIGVRWAIVLGFLLLLEIIGQKKLVSPTMISPPSVMITKLFQLSYEGKITANLTRTMVEVFAAFSLAAALGIGLGILFWKLPRFGRLVEPYLVSAYAVPFLLFYPVLLVLLGLGSLPIIVMAAVGSMVSIVLNTWIGFREIREVYVKVGQSLNCTRGQLFRKIYFPAAGPFIFAGLKLGFVYCLIGTIAMEFILAEKGLGFAVHYAYESFETPTMYAYILLIIIIAVLCNSVLFRGEREVAGSGR